MQEIVLLLQMMKYVKNVKEMMIWNLCYFVKNVDVLCVIVIVNHLIIQIKFYVILVELINKDEIYYIIYLIIFFNLHNNIMNF